MCGRYASARSVDDLASTFGVSGDDIDPLPSPDWNVAPTKPVPAVIADAPRTSLTTLR
jgi:putative SOS response-associated peptidase YedK